MRKVSKRRRRCFASLPTQVVGKEADGSRRDTAVCFGARRAVGSTTPQAGLYFWNGADMVPGDGHPNARLVRLASLPAPPGAKAEGILVTREDAGRYTILVVYDGVPGGHPTLFDVQLPTS